MSGKTSQTSSTAEAEATTNVDTPAPTSISGARHSFVTESGAPFTSDPPTPIISEAPPSAADIHPPVSVSDVAPARSLRLAMASSGSDGSTSRDAFARLLALVPTLSRLGDDEAVAREVCATLEEIAPASEVAIVLPPAPCEGDEAPSGHRVVTAHDAVASVVADDASLHSRLFPGHPDEIVVPLPESFNGVRIHFAEALDTSDRDRAIVQARLRHELVDRAALALAGGLLAARSDLRRRDETARLQALQGRIVQAEKMASVGQIAAQVVHELNNPLTAIVSYADYLSKKLTRSEHDEADLERLRRIGASADRILRFSRDLTTYARPRAEGASPVAMREIVERAVMFCEHVLAERWIATSVTVDPATPMIVGMSGELTQVFVNLVTNAAHAIEDVGNGRENGGGRVDVVVEPAAGGAVRVSVGDNGGGISPENVVRVFDPFFTTKVEGRGTGLGLSIVRTIVEGHGGRVWVRSVAGHGAQFIVELAPHPPRLSTPPT